jgi:hypothetical protein
MEKNLIPLTLYLAVFITVLIIFWIIFVFKKKSLSMKDFLKLLIYSLLGTLLFEFVYFFIGSSQEMFMVLCEPGGKCPNQFDFFVANYLPSSSIIVFLSITTIYSATKYFKK